MKPTSKTPIQRDWISKAIAGVVLGMALALVASAWFVHLHPEMPAALKAQLAMWMVPPIWLGIASSVFFFSSGLKAWLWLGGSTMLLASLYVSARGAI